MEYFLEYDSPYMREIRLPVESSGFIYLADKRLKQSGLAPRVVHQSAYWFLDLVLRIWLPHDGLVQAFPSVSLPMD